MIDFKQPEGFGRQTNGLPIKQTIVIRVSFATEKGFHDRIVKHEHKINHSEKFYVAFLANKSID